jgi:subtilisin family serine protease
VVYQPACIFLYPYPFLGIDYNHPNLGGGFGRGKKVAGGYDFVGNDFDGATVVTPSPDADPLDCEGHGTHVAGIIGASGKNNLNVSGIAPDASLYAYKIFGCEGGTTDDGKPSICF